MTDTPPEIEALYREMLMKRSGSERFMMAIGMFDGAREIIISTMPPGLSPVNQKRFIYRRTYGEEAPDGLVKMWEARSA